MLASKSTAVPVPPPGPPPPAPPPPAPSAPGNNSEEIKRLKKKLNDAKSALKKATNKNRSVDNELASLRRMYFFTASPGSWDDPEWSTVKDVQLPKDGSHDAVYFFNVRSGLVVLKIMSNQEVVQNAIADDVFEIVGVRVPHSRIVPPSEYNSLMESLERLATEKQNGNAKRAHAKFLSSSINKTNLLLAMEFVPGNSFDDLRLDRVTLGVPSALGFGFSPSESISSKNTEIATRYLLALGGIIAGDLFINGSDRFWFKGIWSHPASNFGNVMVTKGTNEIVTIDHDFGTIRDEEGINEYASKVGKFLSKLVENPLTVTDEIKELATHFGKPGPCFEGGEYAEGEGLDFHLDEQAQAMLQAGIIHGMANLAAADFSGELAHSFHRSMETAKIGDEFKRNINKCIKTIANIFTTQFKKLRGSNAVTLVVNTSMHVSSNKKLLRNHTIEGRKSITPRSLKRFQSMTSIVSPDFPSIKRLTSFSSSHEGKIEEITNGKTVEPMQKKRKRK